MTLRRGFSKVNKDGQVVIPKNIIKEVGLKDSQIVEIRVQGAGSSRYITLKGRKETR